MKKGKTTKLLAVCLTAALLSGCGKSGGNQPSAAPVETAAQEAAPQTDREQDGETAAGETDFQIGERPSLIAGKGQEGEAVTAAVEPYAIEADLGNVQNLEQFYLTEEMKQMLARNGFMVMENGGKEFFDIACGEGALRVLTVQLEGKKKMSVKDFLLGYDVREENFDVTG